MRNRLLVGLCPSSLQPDIRHQGEDVLQVAGLEAGPCMTSSSRSAAAGARRGGWGWLGLFMF